MEVNKNVIDGGSRLGFEKNIEAAEERKQELIRQLSSGDRLESASVDVANLAVSRKLQSTLGNHEQNMINLQDNISKAQTEDGGLRAIGDSIKAIQTLKTQAGNDTLTDEDKKTIQNQIDGLIEGIGKIVDDTKFNMQKSIKPSDGLKDILENGVDIDEDSQGLALVAEEVDKRRTELGTELNSLDRMIKKESIAYENVMAAYSQVRDMDMARGIIDLTNAQSSSQAGFNMVSGMFNFNKSLVLKLLN